MLPKITGLHIRQRVFLAILLSGVGILLAYRLASFERGLIGQYYPNVAWSGFPSITRIDSTIDPSRLPAEFSAPIYGIQWTGRLYIPVSGVYEFATASGGVSVLTIADKLSLNNSGAQESPRRSDSLLLQKGFYPITIRYAHQTGIAALDVYWTRPGKQQEILPAMFLFPQQPGAIRLRLEQVLAAGKLLWVIGVLVAGLIFVSRRQFYTHIPRYVNLPFLGLLLFLGLINIPYLAPAFHFIPGHDAMLEVLGFSVAYNEYFLHDEFPLWMPNHVYGTTSDYTLMYGLSPAGYFMAWIGKLLAIEDALVLFIAAAILEQVFLLVGMYLLSSRLFSNRVTVMLICLTSTAMSGFWAFAICTNLRVYFLLPLVLFCLIKYSDTGKVIYLLLAGILALFALVYSVYYIPYLFLLLLVFAVGLFWPKYRTLCSWSAVKSVFKPLPLGLLSVLGVLAIVFLRYTTHVFDYTIMYAPNRDHLTGAVPLRTLLTYGPTITLTQFLELLYAIPFSADQNLYVGLIPLIFFVYLFIRVRSYPHLLKTLGVTLAVMFLVGLAYFTVVQFVLYLFFPLWDHIRLIRTPLKILFLLVSGFGIDAWLTSGERSGGKDVSLIWIGAGLATFILGLDLFVFRGTMPYSTYLSSPSTLYQFHYITLGILALGFGLLYRAIRFDTGHIRAILIGCVALEMASFHYFVMFMSPARIPDIPLKSYETAEEHHEQRARIKSSLTVFDYPFQAQRTPSEETSRLMSQTAPMLRYFWGAKYSRIYSAAYVDPCVQECRIDYLTLSVDRLGKARLGLPLDKPLAGEFAPFPSINSGDELSQDQVFLRAIGCQSPKLFLTSQVRIAHSLNEAAALIKTSQDIDTVPVIWSETGQDIPSVQQSSSQAASAGVVNVTDFTANRLSVQAQVASPAGAWLIYLDAYHPKWTVTVNGSPRPLMTANLAFKAVHLDPGPHAVQFTFTGSSVNRFSLQVLFVIGIISVLALLGTTWYLAMPGLVPKRRLIP